MVSEFVREQKRYTQKELCAIMHCEEKKAVRLIRKLKVFNVLKAVKNSKEQQNLSDLVDEDIEVGNVETGSDRFLYVFTFVGVIVVAGCVLKCYPKYLKHNNAPKEKLQQVLKVLDKCNSKEQIIQIFNDSSEGSEFNLLAVLLFLMQDYYENGIYRNTVERIESNGPGEILWDKTINETFMLLSRNRPYYVDLQTRRRVTNEHDYFTRLHECILTQVSKELRDADLLDLFEITEVDLTEESLDDFGEKDYVLNQIEKELRIQFNTRKQILLKTIYSYIAEGGNLHDIDGLSLFGTNNFAHVWEVICADILDNQLNVSLEEIPLPVPLKSKYNEKQKLIELIEKPYWSAADQTARDTLIPDLVAIKKVKDEWQFIIFDAKYYTPRLKAGVVPEGQPGIESITKQYLYQLAYKGFIEDHKFEAVKNCFLMPTENAEPEERGEVSLDMLHALGLQNIKVRLFPADMAYEHYLSGRKMDIAMLNL